MMPEQQLTGDEHEERVVGRCRRCDQLGLGTLDGTCDPVTDWIVDHAGCLVAE